MGNISSQQLRYSSPVPDTATEDCSEIYRCEGFVDGLISNFEGAKALKNVYDVLKSSAETYAEHPFLGKREINEDGTLGKYVWHTYKEVNEKILQAGSGFLYNQLAPSQKFDDFRQGEELRFVGIFSKNRIEWSVCDYACAAYNITLIPLYDTLAASSIKFILKQTMLSTIVASNECAQKLLEIDEAFEFLKTVIVFDKTEKVDELAKAKKITVWSWDELLASGKANLMPLDSIKEATLDSISTISYTSGTTGDPKGVVITHKNFIASIAGLAKGPALAKYFSLTDKDVIISYLPLAHVYERIVELLICSVGAKIGFYSGDVLKISDDAKALNPTVFVSVPRLFYRVYDKVLNSVNAKPALIKNLFHHAMHTKAGKESNNAIKDHWLYDAIFFNKVKAALGDSTRLFVSGSASLSTSVQASVKGMFCAPFVQGYGLTETMGGSFIGYPQDPELGHVGGPTPSVEFKIKSVPSMEYNAKADTPKGELLLRGPHISPGYFRNMKVTEEMYDSDGWLYTGDIAEITKSGAIKIIDRSKNIFKLSQGEYVTPEKVEGALGQLAVVEQIYVTGESAESFPVAVVVPNEAEATQWAQANGKGSVSLKAICDMPEFNEYILKEFSIAGKVGLNGFEIPKAIYLTDEQFTIENQLLTSTFKLKREVARKVYKSQIIGLYAKQKKG